MNDMDLLKTMELVDDDIIEKNARAPKRKSSAYFKWAAAAAAALILGILLSALFTGGAPSPSTTGPQQLESVPTLPTNSPLPPTSTAPWLPTEPITFPVPDDLISLSAQDIMEIFRYESSGTLAAIDSYETAYFSEVLTNKEIPWTGYLPVYQRVYPELTKDMLEDFVAQSLPIIQGIYPQYPIEQLYPSNYTITELDSGFVTSDRYENYVDSKNYSIISVSLNVRIYNYRQLNMYGGLYLREGSYSGLTIPVNGQIYKLDCDDTIEEIRHSLSGLVEYLNQLFAGDYKITDTTRQLSRCSGHPDHTSQICVILEPASASKSSLLPDSIYLYFKALSDGGCPTNTAVFCEIGYGIPILQPEDNYALVGHGTMLTLEEAEALMEKGFFFSHVPRCTCGAALTQKELEFSDYDAVELRWIERDDGLFIPFYSFYVQTGYSTVQQKYTYGRVNVPAIAVEDLEAFFESIDENHNHYYGR